LIVQWLGGAWGQSYVKNHLAGISVEKDKGARLDKRGQKLVFVLPLSERKWREPNILVFRHSWTM
jgi:hypothetical protein